ncbi:MAG: hypothetical protein KC646_10650 [Candidatus Cloacimonetes bacterium]|nr:hypothetical protein [Candidatus Cloacimonadota bacterium]
MNPTQTLELVQSIKSTQTTAMKVPPKHENFFTDLGLFLLNYKRFLPGVNISLIDCVYFGLYPLNKEDIAMTIQVSFQVDGLEDPIITKGYLIPTDPMKQLDNVPSKGDPINVEVEIPNTMVTIDGDQVKVNLMKGRYKEQFLPLLLNEYESRGY